ncbi:Calcium permeable stress-gated cation channel 1 [Vitis vinifera]|uniref:Calcium permeable stress-gated cation channel 1 n=1 Tax=Vitis vinifera TaxID=29760 RepID=A0A438ILB5_VITVI|nr:Calcium permeable stress-gated cation channel 1 [Vitis vinifera]
MATLYDIAVAAAINILTAFAFFIAFAILRIQPCNDRVYFPKWYLKGLRNSPLSSGVFVKRFVNLDFRSYLRFLNWMLAALQMPEPELIDHAGLDSAVYLRIYWTGLKIFVPIALLAFSIMVPVNWSNGTLEHSGLTYSNIDKLSISNVPTGSPRFWTHLVMAYVFSFWTCYVLKKEYEIVATMRLHFLASERRRPDQFTVRSTLFLNKILNLLGELEKSLVIVRNVPSDPDESVLELVEHFFLVNHPNHFLGFQVGPAIISHMYHPKDENFCTSTSYLRIFMQAVYDANKLFKLVDEKKKMHNWLDYYQLKYVRDPSKRPTLKVLYLQ